MASLRYEPFWAVSRSGVPRKVLPEKLDAGPALRQHGLLKELKGKVEVTKALAALQPLYGKDNIEVITQDGSRVRGVVRSMKTTQALTKPSVKMERPDGVIVKVAFDTIAEIIDHNL